MPVAVLLLLRLLLLVTLRVQVIRLKAALNEKDMELIELREQHMQLVVSSSLEASTGSGTTICAPSVTAGTSSKAVTLISCSWATWLC